MILLGTEQAEAPPLLYPNGRGRRAPGRLRGYDRMDPILPMPEQGKIGGLDINREAEKFFDDAELWRQRAKRLEVLRCRKLKHTPRCKGGEDVPRDQLGERRWLRGDWTATELRFFRWIAMIAQVRSNQVGLWNGSGVDSFTREQIAERIDSHHRRDAQGRMRAPQVDRLIRAALDARFIVRIEQRDFDEASRRYYSKAAIFKVTNFFWEFCGVKRQRDALIASEKKTAPAPAPKPPERTKAERLEGWRMANLAGELVNHLAGEHVPDYGGGWKPPPERKPKGTGKA